MAKISKYQKLWSLIVIFFAALILQGCATDGEYPDWEIREIRSFDDQEPVLQVLSTDWTSPFECAGEMVKLKIFREDGTVFWVKLDFSNRTNLQLDVCAVKPNEKAIPVSSKKIYKRYRCPSNWFWPLDDLPSHWFWRLCDDEADNSDKETKGTNPKAQKKGEPAITNVIKLHTMDEVLIHDKRYKYDDFPSLDGTLTREHLIRMIGLPDKHEGPGIPYDIYCFDSGHELWLGFFNGGKLANAFMVRIVNHERVAKKFIYPKDRHD